MDKKENNRRVLLSVLAVVAANILVLGAVTVEVCEIKLILFLLAVASVWKPVHWLKEVLEKIHKSNE